MKAVMVDGVRVGRRDERAEKWALRVLGCKGFGRGLMTTTVSSFVGSAVTISKFSGFFFYLWGEELIWSLFGGLTATFEFALALLSGSGAGGSGSGGIGNGIEMEVD